MRHVSPSNTAVATRNATEYRTQAEILRSRAHLLAGDDRVLVQMYLEHGNRFRQIALLTGLNRTSIARRIRRISQRLVDDTYALCLSHRTDFSDMEMAIIKDHFIHGLSKPAICRRRKVTLYRVKTTIRKARRHAASQEERK